MIRKSKKLLHFVTFFNKLVSLLHISFGAGTRAASRYGSGSAKMIQLLAAPALDYKILNTEVVN
jgi:hypothetical protein